MLVLVINQSHHIIHLQIQLQSLEASLFEPIFFPDSFPQCSLSLFHFPHVFNEGIFIQLMHHTTKPSHRKRIARKKKRFVFEFVENFVEIAIENWHTRKRQPKSFSKVVASFFLYLRFIRNALSIFNRSHFCLECVVQFHLTHRNTLQFPLYDMVTGDRQK